VTVRASVVAASVAAGVVLTAAPAEARQAQPPNRDVQRIEVVHARMAPSPDRWWQIRYTLNDGSSYAVRNRQACRRAFNNPQGCWTAYHILTHR
jgi:hypothetical protein